jgi:hypothetical protein
MAVLEVAEFSNKSDYNKKNIGTDRGKGRGHKRAR